MIHNGRKTKWDPRETSRQPTLYRSAIALVRFMAIGTVGVIYIETRTVGSEFKVKPAGLRYDFVLKNPN
jgi:hypothetical protein